MRLDHLSYAAGPDGLAGTAERIGTLLGATFIDGGLHPRFGTKNMTLALSGGTYLEVVAVLDHPASDKAPFGQAVRARSALGGGWMGSVISVEDITPIEQRLGREAVPGNRKRPDGTELLWKQIGINGLIADPQLPFFIEWLSPESERPGAIPTPGLAIRKLEVAGDPKRVAEWIGLESTEDHLNEVEIAWTAPHGTPGMQAVTFDTLAGPVRI